MAQAAQRGTSAVNGTSSSSNANAGASGGGATASTSSNKDIPRDARIIGLILASLGVTDAEPGVVAMLLEFAHRYTLEILQDAQVYAEHAQRPRDPTAASTSPLEVDDLRMAVSSKLEHSYSSPLPKEFLLPLAAQINRVPLPILPESYGIRLPHERDRLTAVNWDLAPVTEKRSYPELEQLNQAQNGLNQQGQAEASTSQAIQPNGTQASNSAMDLDMAGNDLFGGHGDEDEDDDDDDDDEDDDDMEEVVDTSLQADRSHSKDVEDAEADEDAEEEDDDAEEDDDNGDDDEDDEDGDGQDDT